MAEQTLEKSRVHENSREVTYTSVLKMLNHDFKGTVLNLQSKVAQLDETNDSLQADLTHIHQSLMSIPYRCKQTSKTQGCTKYSALSAVMETLAHLFPQAIICSLDLDVGFVPCLLHLVLYQLLRNACVHGGGQVTCNVTNEGGYAVISVSNPPGEGHWRLMDAGDDALELAMSGATGKVSSSGLGLRDSLSLIEMQSECRFSIEWRTEDVLAQLHVPIIAREPIIELHNRDIVARDTRIRICVIDDQLGARMTAIKLIKFVIDDYKPPPKLKALEAVWEDDDVKVAGSELIHLTECISWVNHDPKRTIVFLDRMLEYPGKCVDGLDLIPELSAQGALVVMRSGNDSDEDIALYMERGAFGVVSKVLHGTGEPDILTQAKVCIAEEAISSEQTIVFGVDAPHIQARLQITHPTPQCIRICVIDDQLGARMTAVKLIKFVIDGYKPPPKLKALEAVWEDDDVKVAGSELIHLTECISWVNHDPKRTIVFLDRMLEYPGKCVDGLDLIPELSAQGALVVMRSGNDSDEDIALYMERGAFGVVSKVLHGTGEPDILTQAKLTIAGRS